MNMVRRPIVGGNWKCNGTLAKCEELVKMLNGTVFPKEAVEVVIAPVAVHLGKVQAGLDKSKGYELMLQNPSRTAEGAFTGEISVGQIVDFGLKWTLIGHSERRQYYGESDQVVADKVKIAQEAGLTTMVCIGESLDEREGNKTMEVLNRQCQAFIGSVKDWGKTVVAYEPVWAIGTGKVATAAQAQETHDQIRKFFSSKVSADVAKNLRILYGGSVTETNCAELIGLPDVDGFLVGGASLKPAFSQIITTVGSASH
eukprot:Platyproteum_vivax@DN8314_c0_g1_i1.p1